MNTKDASKLIEKEWELSGFFGRLRGGVFDNDRLNKLIQLLEDVELDLNDKIDRRFVSLIWYIPLFIGWQIERIEDEKEIDLLKKGRNKIEGLLEEILGIP
ncbi:MAG: hypothetical protein KAT32_04590 [Candidatus Moranbacteria bacterium]|nr:hypothetical protein [Candidatus Moranbacteria bacterium]